MELLISIFKLLAGIGLFLFAMYLLEESLKNLSGRSFKLFLQRITKNKYGAVVGGAIVTAILQSSSLVSVMVLAFVGAGVFTMKNALAIILGANLGTTFSSWMVATLGFKVNIETAAYPAVFIGGLLLILFRHRRIIRYISFFLFGFGLLFIGLSFMKTAMEVQVNAFDFSRYREMPMAVFLLIGFLITLLVQSSSVTMALTLSAIYAGVIDFAPAAAIVLGSESGTTIKILLSTLGGSIAKKRVGLGSLLFNVFLTVFTFIFLSPILYLITDVLKVNDPLIGLVVFSSLINLLSILIFLPFLDLFARFLERFFKDTNDSAAAFIGNANQSEPETALDLFRKETEYFIFNSMLFNLLLFGIDSKLLKAIPDFEKINEKKRINTLSHEEQYEFLKQLQGELQVFYISFRSTLQGAQNSQLSQLISSVRSAMHSVKSMKDIGTNIINLKSSSKNIKYDFFVHHKKETEDLYQSLNAFMMKENPVSFDKLHLIFDDIQKNYSSALDNFYKDAHQAAIQNIDMTTAINFNREIFTSNKAMLMAVKDFLLDEKQAEDFNEIIVYKS